MTRSTKYAMGSVLFAVVPALGLWGLRASHTEAEHEKEAEESIHSASSVKHLPDGTVLITLDRDTQERIATRGSIMMISHFEHLVHAEGRTWSLETAIRGATERIVPVLMTAIVTALGLLPIALGSGEAGREIEGPMAIVILGGLMTSTILNLLVLPTLALHFGRFRPHNEHTMPSAHS